jgi:hypothetical protein
LLSLARTGIVEAHPNMLEVGVAGCERHMMLDLFNRIPNMQTLVNHG